MKGTYISIWGYVVMVLADDLNVYEQWASFQRHGVAREEDLSERKEIFIEILMRKGLVNPVTDAEVLPEKYENYFEWFFMKSDPKAELVPSPDEMATLHRKLGCEAYHAMDVYTRELFATGYKSDLMVAAGMLPAMYFEWLIDPKAGTLEEKKMALFRSWFERNQRMAAEQQGFAVQNVASNNPKDKWSSFSYTYGAQDKLGYEVAIVNAGPRSGAILAQITKWAIDTGGFMLDMPFEVPGYTVGNPPSVLKAVATELDMVSPLAQAMLGAKNQGMTRAVQIFIADANNILPTEEGYDTGFVQEYAETPE